MVSWCVRALYTSVKVLSPRVKISAVAEAMFALAWLNKNNQKNQKMNNLGVFVSWRLTTLAKLSVDVSDVVSHKLSI